MLFSRMAFGVAVLLTGLTSALPRREDTKYFHEPGNSDDTGHYDFRYFNGVVDYDTRLDTLRKMTRAWLQMTEKEGLETWISHGTLLGWWWNGKILPWDWDLDVQMHADTLTDMGNRLNQTKHLYVSADDGVQKEYFLDVNAWIFEREIGDGMNIIDARWIDTKTGLYIDITGVAETKPFDKPGIFVAKNYDHSYARDEIWPLRETIFEGERAQIPYSYVAMLEKEYNPKALVTTEFEGHRWNTKTKTWEIAPDVLWGADGMRAHQNPRVPRRYSTVDTGGFFYGIYRLFHWW